MVTVTSGRAVVVTVVVVVLFEVVLAVVVVAVVVTDVVVIVVVDVVVEALVVVIVVVAVMLVVGWDAVGVSLPHPVSKSSPHSSRQSPDSTRLFILGLLRKIAASLLGKAGRAKRY